MIHKSYEELLNEKRVWYKAVAKSYCPILSEFIIFNSKLEILHFTVFGKKVIGRQKDKQKSPQNESCFVVLIFGL
ncbi:MAG: hypothetical protein WCP15_01060 [bacterium]